MLTSLSKTAKLTNYHSFYIIPPAFSVLNSKLIPLPGTRTFENTYFSNTSNLSKNLTHHKPQPPCINKSDANHLNYFNKFNLNRNLLPNNTWKKHINGLTRLRKLWEKYGYTSIFTYFTIYIATFTSFWILAIYDVLNATKIIKIISILKLDNHINSSKIEQKMKTPFGKLFLAWISTKIVEPLRLFSTITLTPFFYKLFKR